MTSPQQQNSPFLTQESHQEIMHDPGTFSSNAYHHQNHSYGYWGATNLAEKDRKPPQKHEYRYRNWYDHHQEAMKSDDHSGVASPPLWKSSSPSPSRPLLSHHNYRSLSPNSRADAIVRGQWELMEMVRNMPESSYELSLKDIVEHHRAEAQAPQTGDRSVDGNHESLHQRAVVKVKREEGEKIDRNLSFENKKIDRNLSFENKKIDRNLRFENKGHESLHQRAVVRVKREEREIDRNPSFENKGMFLNMVFPFSFKSKKKNRFSSNNCAKVSPKPEGLKGGGEREWWKKKFTGSSDSDSSRTTNNSGGGGGGGIGGGGGGSSPGSSGVGGRERNGFFCGCWPFFHSTRSKSAE